MWVCHTGGTLCGAVSDAQYIVMRSAWERAARETVRAGGAGATLPRASFGSIMQTLRLGSSDHTLDMLRSVHGGTSAALNIEGRRARRRGAHEH